VAQVTDLAPAGELSPAQRRFVDDIGQAFARYGLPLTIGRVFGLLLINNEPLSLDDMAAQLQVSKTATSVAARDLERIGAVRRLATPGSRRIVYEADDTMEPIIEAQFARMRHMLMLLQRSDGILPPGRAMQRLRNLQELYEFSLRESVRILERWRERTVRR
jgi:predicted transcriptional regulator